MVTGDCHDQQGLKNRCVAGAIKSFTSQLLHYQEGSSDRKCQLNVPENCKSWIGTWQFRKQRKFSSFEISTAKGNLKNEFFLQNVNEDNKWCFDLFYAKNLKFFFFWVTLADNLTEALLFLSHFMGDIHQVQYCDQYARNPPSFP